MYVFRGRFCIRGLTDQPDTESAKYSYGTMLSEIVPIDLLRALVAAFLALSPSAAQLRLLTGDRLLETFHVRNHCDGNARSLGFALRRCIASWVLLGFPDRHRTRTRIQEAALLCLCWLFRPYKPTPRLRKMNPEMR